MVNFKKAFESLHLNKEICFIVNDDETLSGRYTINTGDRRRKSCIYSFRNKHKLFKDPFDGRYPHVIVHTHPTTSKPYPSMEDIIKVLKHPEITKSYIVTAIGVWCIFMEGHENIWTDLSKADQENLKSHITKIDDSHAYPYFKRNMTKPIPDDDPLLGYADEFSETIKHKIIEFSKFKSRSRSKSESKSRSRSKSRSISIDIFLDDTINLSTYDKGTFRRNKLKKRSPSKKKRQTRRKSLKLRISEKKYKQLISQRRSRKKMSLQDKNLLDDSLYVKYCQCLRKFEYTKDKRGYPICMASVYKRRTFKPPHNAANRCKLTFNKNVGK